VFNWGGAGSGIDLPPGLAGTFTNSIENSRDIRPADGYLEASLFGDSYDAYVVTPIASSGYGSGPFLFFW
jgi:hypothetical protein